MRARESNLTQSEHSVAGAIHACNGLSDWQRAQSIFDGSKIRTVCRRATCTTNQWLVLLCMCCKLFRSTRNLVSHLTLADCLPSRP